MRTEVPALALIRSVPYTLTPHLVRFNGRSKRTPKLSFPNSQAYPPHKLDSPHFFQRHVFSLNDFYHLPLYFPISPRQHPNPQY
ncbi:hypothetical protein CDAR_509861 [Caerostris darwini]|uniref:Uncharacterized protein n=1 Tax=Caerostris darwini TaxID=1538125 RepID=A0AAV4TVD7_9ARAC|nr:hypothetical protein CDAR_509861 [Caerostris darwini]